MEQVKRGRGRPLAGERWTPEQIEEAIKGSAGIFSVIAKKLNCHWGTAKKTIMENELYRTRYQEERESVLDMAESTIFKSVKSGDTQSAKWLLATIGKNRGFVEKQELQLSGADGGPVAFAYVDPPKKDASPEEV